MFKKILFVNLLLAGLFVVSPAMASYDNPCQQVYGGGYGGAGNCNTQGNILLNKTVLNPQTNSYQDNLGMDDPKYVPGENISFQLAITNIGNATISKATVSDTFPVYIQDVKGPGSYDSASRVLTFSVTDLNPNETRIFTVSGKIVAGTSLPEDVTCALNQANAASDNQVSQDSSKFCVQKQVVTGKGGLPVMQPTPMKQTPATGPEMLTLIGLIPAGLSGFLLRKKSNKI